MDLPKMIQALAEAQNDFGDFITIALFVILVFGIPIGFIIQCILHFKRTMSLVGGIIVGFVAGHVVNAVIRLLVITFLHPFFLVPIGSKGPHMIIQNAVCVTGMGIFVFGWYKRNFRQKS